MSGNYLSSGDDNDTVDLSAEMEQDYAKRGLEVNQNVVSQFVQEVDHSVFDNQNIQCAYHQLPNIWDQILQVQTPLCLGGSPEKSDDMKDEQKCQSTVPSQSNAYQNQKQHNPFASKTSRIVDAWPCINGEDEIGNKSAEIEKSGDTT